MVDKHLFVYLTKRAGKTMDDAAKAMRVSRTGLSNRLNGKVEFRIGEVEAWAALIGASDNVGPVFFQPGVADTRLLEQREDG